MFDKILQLMRKERDSLVFQISQETIEVTALRQDEESAKKLGDMCVTETLYSKRVPISKPSDKKVLDELAEQLRKLADTAVSSQVLTEKRFSLRRAKIVCVFVEPLSTKATVVYEASSDKEVKVTMKTLEGVLTDERVVESNLQDAPKGYAMYAQELTKIELNGYNTHKPLGRYVKSIKLSVEKYLIDPKLWSATGVVLESIFNRDIHYVHTEQVLDVSLSAFCNEIYTVDELQTITNDIL